MHFSFITNAAISNQNDRPLMQKEVFEVSKGLQQYLKKYHRDIELPIAYNDLLNYQYTNAIKDENGKHTHWENVVYAADVLKTLHKKLLSTFQLLTLQQANNFVISAIDFCEFANSMPYRITVLCKQTKVLSWFYIKMADASRLFGLELEYLFSTNTINFLYHKNTLVETHIDGIPGDDFIVRVVNMQLAEKIAVAKAFIEFNEHCFARLLGDMRSYNFVVLNNTDGTYTFKPIDFDQQCYEGNLALYFAQFYKENYQYFQLVTEVLNNQLIEQHRQLARKNMAEQAKYKQLQIVHILEVLLPEQITDGYKIIQLKNGLNAYFKIDEFTDCKTMGNILIQLLQQLQIFSFPLHKPVL
jgi:hypothetical protein